MSRQASVCRRRRRNRRGKARQRASINIGSSIHSPFWLDLWLAAAIFRSKRRISSMLDLDLPPARRPKSFPPASSPRRWPAVYAALNGSFQTEARRRTCARLRRHRGRFPCRPDAPVGRPRAVVCARHRNPQRAPAFDRGGRRTCRRRRAHGPRRAEARMDRRQPRARRPAQSVDAACGHAAVLQGRRDA